MALTTSQNRFKPVVDLWHMWLSALFLRHEVYEYQRDRRNPFAHGLLFIVVLGALLALFGILGSGLRYATEPRAEAIQSVVLTHLQAMPFYTQFTPQEETRFLSGYNQTWDRFGSFFVGYPTTLAGLALLLSSIVTTPLFWIVGWLLYGALAHLVAHRATRDTTLSEGLGALALATSPQLLKALEFLPGASVNSLMIGAWTLICNFVALRAAYRLTVGRAVWAALFPLLLLLLLLLVLFGIASVALGSLVRGGQP